MNNLQLSYCIEHQGEVNGNAFFLCGAIFIPIPTSFDFFSVHNKKIANIALVNEISGFYC